MTPGKNRSEGRKCIEERPSKDHVVVDGYHRCGRQHWPTHTCPKRDYSSVTSVNTLLMNSWRQPPQWNMSWRQSMTSHEADIPENIGESSGKRTLGPRLAYWPSASSMKNIGSPARSSIITYGIRNTAGRNEAHIMNHYHVEYLPSSDVSFEKKTFKAGSIFQ